MRRTEARIIVLLLPAFVLLLSSAQVAPGPFLDMTQVERQRIQQDLAVAVTALSACEAALRQTPEVAWTPALIEAYQLSALYVVELALEDYALAKQALPESCAVLYAEGFLPLLPGNPYDGWQQLEWSEASAATQFVPGGLVLQRVQAETTATAAPAQPGPTSFVLGIRGASPEYVSTFRDCGVPLLSWAEPVPGLAGVVAKMDASTVYAPSQQGGEQLELDYAVARYSEAELPLRVLPHEQWEQLQVSHHLISTLNLAKLALTRFSGTNNRLPASIGELREAGILPLWPVNALAQWSPVELREWEPETEFRPGTLVLQPIPADWCTGEREVSTWQPDGERKFVGVYQPYSFALYILGPTLDFDSGQRSSLAPEWASAPSGMAYSCAVTSFASSRMLDME